MDKVAKNGSNYKSEKCSHYWISHRGIYGLKGRSVQTNLLKEGADRARKGEWWKKREK